MFKLLKRKSAPAVELAIAPQDNASNSWLAGGFSDAVDFKELVKLMPALEIPKPTYGWENGLSLATSGEDAAGDGVGRIKDSVNSGSDIGNSVMAWYMAQNFLGYQLCANLSQHWLIDKACYMPGQDAVRNGFDITVNDGTQVDSKVLDFMRKKDKDYSIKRHLIEFAGNGRRFGIRVAIFRVNSTDPYYYSKPFNLDGVLPGSYVGISQVDPYWMVPQLTNNNVMDPADPNFYEPTFWQIGNVVYHKSHLCIFTTNKVPDILKSSYYYGGVSIPQKIYERVYAAERTANEAPMLAQTKRLITYQTDIAKVAANPAKFSQRIKEWVFLRDNYGVKVHGADEKVDQKDTALGDLDNVIMTQYQLVAAIAEVPGTKLLGTQPKGFNSTGQYEESSYHESLDSLRENKMTPLLERHHQLVIRSDVYPAFPQQTAFETTVNWHSLDEMTGLEKAQLNLVKSQTDVVLQSVGAIDAADIRKRVVNDAESGYNGLSPEPPPEPKNPDGSPAEMTEARPPRPAEPPMAQVPGA